ncbi:MAG: cytochrome c [Mariprofundales bacterium]|nr:cytochrome c [Mariprofundales bacterium]
MKKLVMIVALLAIPVTAMAWPWSRDLMNQPSIKPQEGSVINYPPNSVPVGGLRTKVADRDAAETMVNPVAPTKKSIRMGQALFRIYCMPCHGVTGKGTGPVGKIFELQPADLTSDYVKGLTDGWIWGTITFGSYIMPHYGYDTTSTERWHLVNYIRHKLEKEPVAKPTKGGKK